MKKSFLDKIQDYLDSAKGRVLLNYLYSWGAAVVILGALFKLTHINGADIMLFIGMGTEVLVFFISGFERPFIPGKEEEEDGAESTGIKVRGGGTIVIGGPVSSDNVIPASVQTETVAQPAIISQPGAILDTEGTEHVTQQYLEQLRDLTEKMQQISQQSERIGQSTEELESLGRNLISINTFYEMHLRSVSGQMNTLDQVNGQTQKMLAQIEELNSLYSRMVKAMKINEGGITTGSEK